MCASIRSNEMPVATSETMIARIGAISSCYKRDKDRDRSAVRWEQWYKASWYRRVVEAAL